MRSYKPDEIVRIQVFQGDVRDGDSFGARDLTDNSQIEVRLFGIDAPEGLQTHGNESGDELRSILFEGDSGPSDFNMQFMDWDVGSENEAVQRVVGLVYKEYPDESVNGQIVRSGWAYWFQRYDPLNSFGFRELEEEARGEEIGIWKGDRLEIKPWDYRRFHRRFTEDSDALIDTIERRVREAVKRIGRHSNTIADNMMDDAQTVIADLGKETARRENRKRRTAEKELEQAQSELSLATQRIQEMEDELRAATNENVLLNEQYLDASGERDKAHEKLGYIKGKLSETEAGLKKSMGKLEEIRRLLCAESRTRVIWKGMSLVLVWLTTGAALFALLHFYAIERALQSRAPIEWLLFFVAIPATVTGMVWYGCQFVNERRK